MRARAAGQQPEAVAESVQLRPERVRDAGLEPADHPGAPAAQQRAVAPRLAEDRVEPVHAPDRERVRRVPAGDVHGVVREHELPEVLRRPRVEREVGGLGPPGERLVERDQQPLGIAGGRRHEQDAGSVREVEHEVVEAGPEGKASDRKDPTRHAGEYRIGCRLFAQRPVDALWSM